MIPHIALELAMAYALKRGEEWMEAIGIRFHLSCVEAAARPPKDDILETFGVPNRLLMQEPIKRKTILKKKGS